MTLSASTLADGVYRICTNMDTDLVCDIDGISKSDMANMMLGAENGGNNQVYKMDTWDTSYKRFFAVHSGKVIEAYGDLTPDGNENISQFTWNGGANQYWALKHFTDDNDDGEVIYASNNANVCWDVIYAIASNRQNITVSPAHPGAGVNNGRNQLWTFIKDSMFDTKLPTPAGVGWSWPGNSNIYPDFAFLPTAQDMRVGWAGSAGDYQVRYRWRGRYTGTDSWGDWGSWSTIGGSTDDEGWGNAWAKNETPTTSGGKCYTSSNLSVTVDQTTYDKKQYQVQVRRCGANSTYGLTHGSSATGTLSAAYWPTMTVKSATIGLWGLCIAFTSDFRRGGNTVDIVNLTCNGKSLMNGQYTVKNLGYSASVTIPWSRLNFIPDQGASVTFGANLWTIDTGRYQTFENTVAYSSGYVAATTLPTQTVQSDKNVMLTFPDSSADRSCTLLYDEGGKTIAAPAIEASDEKMWVTPPMNKAYRVQCSASQSNGKFWTAIVDGIVVESDSCFWNLDDGNAVEGFLHDGAADWPRSVEPDSAAYLCNGDEYESVYFSGGAKSTMSADFVFPFTAHSGHPYSTYDNSIKLQRGVHAVFRTPEGDRYRVAVTGVSTKRVTKEYRIVSISMRVCE